MWPIIKGMVIDLLEIEHNYILEGTYLLPNNLNQLSSEFSKSVRSLYIGYAEITVADKQEQIKNGAGMQNDWMNGMASDDVKNYVERGIQQSKWAKAQCSELGVKYLDTGREFDRALESGIEWLSDEKSQ